MSVDAEFQIMQKIMKYEDELEDAKARGDARARRRLKEVLHKLHERRRAIQDN